MNSPAFLSFLGLPIPTPGSRKHIHGIRRSIRITVRRKNGCCRMLKDKGDTGEEVAVSLVKDNKLDERQVDVGEEGSTAVEEGEEEEEDTRTEEQKEIDRLRAAEKFIRVDEGNYECTACGYVYEKNKGEFLSGIPKGTEFADLPADFRCPSCKSPTTMFKKKYKTIAGFAENQQYGLGSNTLTGGQKSALIYGGLLIGFLILLSGYLLN
eukprot:Plantae.Rhodophyta-Hildenbrandia_rubra.ctg8330.p1 GENE.Plantae.Rhodophyta-Hildenbrandia_rubra.ctg8330~~Plantae.Rhodophyta-Hildenbrandia_rubra.ctg8330.p1  ORF type:complete len:224 (+),score=38.83 Plantae.Rhodophyta-Hildenbrandia_rubra.ctg8330:44-673(+)